MTPADEAKAFTTLPADETPMRRLTKPIFASGRLPKTPTQDRKRLGNYNWQTVCQQKIGRIAGQSVKALVTERVDGL